MADTQVVQLYVGPSERYASIPHDPAALYFLNDTNEIFFQNKRYAFGKDINIVISGIGDLISDVTYNESTRTLTIIKGDASDVPSVINAIQTAVSSRIATVYTNRGSAILVDDSDPENVRLSLNLARGNKAGNVVLEQCSDGLSANVELPEVPIKGLAADQKLLKMEGSLLSADLKITTEKEDNTTYIVLKGVGGETISRMDASDFIASGILKSVTIVDKVVGGEIHPFLVLEFYTDGTHTSTVEVDMYSFLIVYKAKVGGGLSLDPVTREFYITNTVTSSSGVNTDVTLNFGTSTTLNTIKYDDHGIITGQATYTISLPEIFGSAGTRDAANKVLTFVSIDNSGELIGQSIDIARTVDASSTDDTIPTSKAVYTAVDNAAIRWNVF